MMIMQNSTRVALLHGYHHHRKVLHLVEHIANETVVLNLDCVDESLSEAVADCDLIIIETYQRLTPHQRHAIQWIRQGSLALIVVLVGTSNTQQLEEAMVDIIPSGADAVIPLSLASDAILAHCQALMRRWRAHPYATPRFA